MSKEKPLVHYVTDFKETELKVRQFFSMRWYSKEGKEWRNTIVGANFDEAHALFEERKAKGCKPTLYVETIAFSRAILEAPKSKEKKK